MALYRHFYNSSLPKHNRKAAFIVGLWRILGI